MTIHSHPERIKLQSGLARLEIDVSEAAIDDLLGYMDLLKEWSGTYNLIAPAERNFLLTRHVLDSLSIRSWLNPGPLLDVGSGAGLPGLPLAITNPEKKVTLIDGSGKKIRFIRHVKRTLKLTNIHPLHKRAEELVQPFENIASRAFASLLGFAEVIRHCAHESTRLYAMKAAYPEQELEALPDWIKVCSVEKLTVPYLHAERHLVIMSLKNKPMER